MLGIALNAGLKERRIQLPNIDNGNVPELSVRLEVLISAKIAGTNTLLKMGYKNIAKNAPL